MNSLKPPLQAVRVYRGRKMDILFDRRTDAAYNLALEEVISTDYPQEAIMLWRNDNAIIVGRNQNTAAEIDAEYVRDHGISVVRRMTGGGAVYHDLGNINYTIIASGRQLEQEAFARNARIVVRVLGSLGVAAEFHGRNDILVAGRKVSGSATRVMTDRTLFHGTLLFDTDLSVLSAALTPDESKIRAKGIKSVRSRVANLKEFLPRMDVENFLAELRDRLLRFTGQASALEIPEVYQRRAEALAEAKYRTWEWNYGTVGSYSYCWKDRFPCGGVEIRFNVVDNRIAGMSITGDFFGSEEVSRLAAQFNGVCPERGAIAEVVGRNDIGGYISGLTREQFLSLFRL